MKEYLAHLRQGVGPYADYLNWCLSQYEEIDVQNSPIDIDTMFFEKKACYVNAAKVVLYHPEVNYVLGFTASIIPIEHAWCEYKSIYFDPTAECLFGSKHFNEYGKIATLNSDQLTQWLEDNKNVPPNLEQIWSQND